MKVFIKLFLSLSLFVCHALSGQIQNGRYISDKTSFKDEVDADNNFIELSRNNVLIDVSEYKEERLFIFEDPRIPDKKLRYRVMYQNTFEEGNRIYYIYTCRSLHLKIPIKTEIIIYWNDSAHMQIMIYNELSSQVFHNLQLTDKGKGD